jgi:DNA-binding SARP family transcriptional activator
MIIETAGFPNVSLTQLVQNDNTVVCLLGSFRLLRNGRPLEVPIVGKAAMLLSTLALRLETGVPRDALLDMIWPKQDAAQATLSLNSLVYSLHRRLGDEAPEAVPIVCANGFYYLNTKVGYSTDIAHFNALVASGNRLVAIREADARRHYEGAVELYRGDLCTGTDVYAVIEREHLRSSFLAVLAWLAEQAYRVGAYAVALDHALKLLAYDPCREDAHRLMMRVHVLRGERAQALRQYRVCEHILRSEFDAAPEPLTTELFERIRNDPASLSPVCSIVSAVASE